jgi:hypothetical protein
MEKRTFRLIAVLLGIAAAVLSVLAVAEFMSYIPATWANGLTDGELGVLAALAVVGAVALGYLSE